MKRTVVLAISLVFLFALGSTSHAGQIVNATFFGDVLQVDQAFNAFNNDNVTQADIWPIFGGIPITDYNWFGIFKDYRSTGPIDISLDVAPTGGTTEYLILEGVANLSEIAWENYVIQLGIGIGDNFQPLSALGVDGIGLDFDTPDKDPTPTSFYLPDLNVNIFNDLNHINEELFFSNGVLAALVDDGNVDISERAFFSYSLDIPDAPDGSTYQFTIRQLPGPLQEEPVIPEPATMALLASGLIGSMALKRKK